MCIEFYIYTFVSKKIARSEPLCPFGHTKTYAHCVPIDCFPVVFFQVAYLSELYEVASLHRQFKSGEEGERRINDLLQAIFPHVILDRLHIRIITDFIRVN